MSGPVQAPATAVGSSPRVALAGLALRAALAVPEVVIGDAGPHGLRVTADPSGGLLVGVSVTAEPDGRYAVDLCLVARLTPLVPLGEAVRRRVHDNALRLGLVDRLGAVNVEFASVVGPMDVASSGTRVPPTATPRTTPAVTDAASPRAPDPGAGGLG